MAKGRESYRARDVPLPVVRAEMLKTFSLSILFFLALGLLFAAYASLPVG
jgi:hypothetical protein